MARTRDERRTDADAPARLWKEGNVALSHSGGGTAIEYSTSTAIGCDDDDDDIAVCWRVETEESLIDGMSLSGTVTLGV